MTTYKIQMMAEADLGRYYSGSNEYAVKEIWVEAESPAEAVAKAKAENPTMSINEHYVKTKEEVEAKAEADRISEELYEKREADRKAKREEAKAKKIAKDLADGITPEMRKAMTYAKRYGNEIADLEKNLAYLKKKKAYWEKIAKGEAE